MSAEIISNFDGIVTARISGTLTYAELKKLQGSVLTIIGQLGSIKALILCEDFNGWDKQSDWSDVSFQSKSDPYINKMAIVGAQAWQDFALMFAGQGFREFPVEFFQPDEIDKARAWLNSY